MRHDTGISPDDVQTFFEDFCRAFAEFDGARVAQRYSAPYMASGTDGSSRVFATSGEIADYFQGHLDRYRSQGCRACSFVDLQMVTMGRHAALASLTWQLRTESGDCISSWRESYNLVRHPEGLRVYASTDHVG